MVFVCVYAGLKYLHFISARAFYTDCIETTSTVANISFLILHLRTDRNTTVGLSLSLFRRPSVMMGKRVAFDDNRNENRNTNVAKRRREIEFGTTSHGELPWKRSRRLSEQSSSPFMTSFVPPSQITTTPTATTTTKSPGQFDDASSADPVNTALRHDDVDDSSNDTLSSSLAAEAIGTAVPDSTNDDGQFDDASEPDVVTEVPVFGSHTTNHKSNAEETTALPRFRGVPQQQPQQLLFPAPHHQVVIPPPPHVAIAPRNSIVATTATPLTPTPPTAAAATSTPVHHYPSQMVVMPSLGLVPIVPRPEAPPRQRQFSDGFLQDHPHRVLEPDSGIPSHARLRPLPPVASDVPTRRYPVSVPLPTDILSGRGNGSNQHAGNIWFRDLIQAYRPFTSDCDAGTCCNSRRI